VLHQHLSARWPTRQHRTIVPWANAQYFADRELESLTGSDNIEGMVLRVYRYHLMQCPQRVEAAMAVAHGVGAVFGRHARQLAGHLRAAMQDPIEKPNFSSPDSYLRFQARIRAVQRNSR